ncbi:MAG: calcium-binding protein [Planctomycetaceae bacterium]
MRRIHLRNLFSNCNFRRTNRRRSRRPISQVTGESLESRVLLTVAATFDAATGVLAVSSDSQGDTIDVSADAGGNLLVNNGTVAIGGDVPTLANTHLVDVDGNAGDDIITIDVSVVGPGVDVDGGDGDDVLTGSNGVDTLRGGAGNDTLIGRKGDDLMLGEDGDDLLIWNNGDNSDFMEGGTGNDVVQVNGADGAGDNFLVRDNGSRVRFDRTNLIPFRLDIGTTETLDVNGLAGDDTIRALGSVGSLISLDFDGGDGNDRLFGSDAADILRGGAGNDTIVGGKGDDFMYGDAGDDVLIWNNGDNSDFMEGGDGNDTVRVNGATTAGDEFSIAPNGSRVQFDRTNLIPFTLDVGTTERLDVNSLGGDDVITASAGLAGLIVLDLDGGDDNDTITGGDGNDILRGGNGDDTLIGLDGNDNMQGGAGNDTLIGGKGDDRMFGQDGDDLLIWNNGDNNDLMEGGAGNDIVQVNGADGAGDEFSVRPNGSRVRFDRTNLIPFRLNIGTSETLDVNGLAGDDTIAATTGLAGLIALDFDGGDGNDLLIGGDGADILRGGAGDDVIVGGKGDDFMYGDDGDDLLIWNNGDNSDLMEGGAGTDTVQVNGADGAGDDFRIAANGSRVQFDRTNLISFTLDIGTTEILDVNEQGGDGHIAVEDVQGIADLQVIDVDGGAGRDVIRGSSSRTGIVFVAEGGDGVDIIIGSNGDDILSGGADDDVIFGRDGNDVLFGGDGRDILFGGLGDDSLFGDAGNDWLFGGLGRDLLDGGDGFDIGFGGPDLDQLLNLELGFN